MKLLSLGNTCVDLVLRHTKSLPVWGGEQLFDDSEERLGGQGANFAIASATLGSRTWLMSAVGNDDRGRRIMSELGSVENLDFSGLRVLDAGTGFSVAPVHQDGTRYFLTFLGHQALFSPGEFEERAAATLQKGDLVHVSGYFMLPKMAEELPGFLRSARTRGAVISFDPGWSRGMTTSHAGKLFWEVVGLADWFLPDEAELMALTSRNSVRTAIRELGRSLRGRLILKRGGRGSEAFEDGKLVAKATAFRINVVDSVGAGDAFDAGFLLGVRSGYSESLSLRLGNATAALMISRTGGPIQRFPSLGEVRRLAQMVG